MSQPAKTPSVLLRVLLFVIVLLTTNLVIGIILGKLTSLLKTEKVILGSPGTAGIVAGIIASLVASVITVSVFRRYADRETLSSLGLQLKGQQSHAATGFCLALVILGCGTLYLAWSNQLLWLTADAAPGQLLTWALLMPAVAFGEELAFRGYLLNSLMRSMNKWTSLFISAIVFALFHGYNPDTTVLALVNIFLAGVLLGINYIYTRNLWFGMAFHAAWNFYQGPVLGFPVSGLQLPGLLTHEISGNTVVTGGSFGFEGSVLYTLLSVLAIMSLAWVYQKRRKV